MVLLFAIPAIFNRVPGTLGPAAIVLGLTIAMGWGLTVAIARVSRIVRLKAWRWRSAGGDLSKAVVSEEQKAFHDEIDDLTEAIRTMQENLRDLVSRIQRTAQSVADSANELQTSAEDVNASTDEVARSMEKIAAVAEEQSGLVERTSKVIGDIASSIERTARSPGDVRWWLPTVDPAAVSNPHDEQYPNMSRRKNTTFGARSGLCVFVKER